MQTPKTHFITYGDAKFTKSRERIAQEAKDTGIFDSLEIYTETDRDRWFNDASPEVKHVLGQARGGGYWLWKPFCIYERLSEVEQGDIVIYADSGCTIYSEQQDIEELKQLIQETAEHELGIMRFLSQFPERRWTKRDVYDAIFPDAFENRRDRQFDCGRIILKKCSNTLEHIGEWRDLALKAPSLFDDSPCKNYNAREFKENRHDQSVFSLITKRRGCLEKRVDDIDHLISTTRIRE